MRKKRLILAGWIAGVLLLILPPLIGLHLAHRWGEAQAIEQLQNLNADLLRRVRAGREQSHSAFDALKTDPGDIPCSATNMARMRTLAARAGYLQAIGFIENNVLKCSTLGFGESIELGPPTRVDPDGAAWWNTVVFPQIPNSKFNIAEKYGWAAIASPELVIDILKPGSSITLGQIGARYREVVRSRGELRPSWIARYDGKPTVFHDGDTIVAMQPSSTGNSAAIAAMDGADVSRRILHFTWRAVPLGLFVGVLLTLGMFLWLRHRLSFKSELRHALQRREFFMVYQPVIELATGRCVGAEALIRWNQRGGGMVSPLVFIPAAEESGLIRQVTMQVMEMVARDAADLIRENPDTHIAINFSAEDLHSPETEKHLQTLLKDAGAASRNIMIEATERGLMTPDKAKDVLISVRSSGFKVAIDDFGTGNSSLSYLATYDLDYLKIDKIFVDALGSRSSSAQVAFHIIEIARSLGLQMIAEGVETEAQREILQDAGVQYAQGWLFGKPMPMRELVDFIRARNLAAAGCASVAQLP
ncbi:EAL domain-containing protein [Xylophilus sp. GOD-11R]|uniref:EAL domain-containing protein n=1 Tax=Xylophilus sp. GOD-11R TaxID=3089814 RepID=UPI00298CB87C|nr:EAL domain-containing protein [Xylophilus sp. GOD-11R]WPB57548.1 EAL domain-containing protein [Xylophilus sp. GOD-11R]